MSRCASNQIDEFTQVRFMCLCESAKIERLAMNYDLNIYNFIDNDC